MKIIQSILIGLLAVLPLTAQEFGVSFRSERVEAELPIALGGARLSTKVGIAFSYFQSVSSSGLSRMQYSCSFVPKSEDSGFSYQRVGIGARFLRFSSVDGFAWLGGLNLHREDYSLSGSSPVDSSMTRLQGELGLSYPGLLVPFRTSMPAKFSTQFVLNKFLTTPSGDGADGTIRSNLNKSAGISMELGVRF